jgi:hypothetical protein
VRHDEDHLLGTRELVPRAKRRRGDEVDEALTTEPGDVGGELLALDAELVVA